MFRFTIDGKRPKNREELRGVVVTKGATEDDDSFVGLYFTREDGVVDYGCQLTPAEATGLMNRLHAELVKIHQRKEVPA